MGHRLMRIPRTTATTLSGLEVTVPDDFTGGRNAVVLAFDRSHLVVCRSWRAALAEALSADATLGFYALAVIGETSFWHHKLVSWALSFDLTDAYSREHTALLSADRETWAAAVGIPSIETPILVVADEAGDVHASAESFPRRETVPHILRALLNG